MNKSLLLAAFGAFSFSFVLLSTIQMAFAADANSLTAYYNDIPQDRKPLYLTFQALQDNSGDGTLSRLEFTLYEKDNKTKVRNVTFAVTLTGAGDKAVLRDVFFSEEGTMIFLLRGGEGDGVTRITGNQEQFLNAWVVEKNGITVSSPSFMANGAYTLTLELLGIDYIRNLLSPENFYEANLSFEMGKNGALEVRTLPRPNLTSFYIESLSVIDTDGAAREWSPVGRPLLISVSVNNTANDIQRYTLFFEVRRNGVTQILEHTIGVVSANGTGTLTQEWTPDVAGTYQIRTFAIDHSDNSNILTYVSRTDFEAIED